jgi:hypothetical protein
MPNVDDRRGLTMFSHVARELGAHQCIGQCASDLASELQDVGGARAIAATGVDGEVSIPTETICRSSVVEGSDKSLRRNNMGYQAIRMGTPGTHGHTAHLLAGKSLSTKHSRQAEPTYA